MAIGVGGFINLVEKLQGKKEPLDLTLPLSLTLPNLKLVTLARQNLPDPQMIFSNPESGMEAVREWLSLIDQGIDKTDHGDISGSTHAALRTQKEILIPIGEFLVDLLERGHSEIEEETVKNHLPKFPLAMLETLEAFLQHNSLPPEELPEYLGMLKRGFELLDKAERSTSTDFYIDANTICGDLKAIYTNLRSEEGAVIFEPDTNFTETLTRNAESSLITCLFSMHYEYSIDKSSCKTEVTEFIARSLGDKADTATPSNAISTTSENASLPGTERSHSEAKPFSNHEIALDELENDNKQKGVWAKAFSETTNQEDAQRLYILLRVAELEGKDLDQVALPSTQNPDKY